MKPFTLALEESNRLEWVSRFFPVEELTQPLFSISVWTLSTRPYFKKYILLTAPFPPSSFHSSCGWEIPRDEDHGGSFERTSKRVNFKYLPEPTHNSTISGKASWKLREEVRKKEKKNHATLSQQGASWWKGENWWQINYKILVSVEDWRFHWGDLLHKKSPLNLPTFFSGKVSSIKCNFKEIRGN